MVDSDHASHCSRGMVFHLLDRANARARILGKETDYVAFEPVMKDTTPINTHSTGRLQETIARTPTRIEEDFKTCSNS
jgi:hypothetical protein